MSAAGLGPVEAAHLDLLRGLGTVAAEPRLREVPGALFLPASFEAPRGAPLPDPGLEAVRRALGRDFPHTSLFDGGAFDRTGACVAEAIHLGARRRGFPQPRVDPSTAAEPLPGTWLLGGVIHNHVGHFLTEDLGRLWALDGAPPPLAGVLWRPVGGSSFAAGMDGDRFPPATVQGQFMRALGADLPQRLATTPLRVERLLVPTQLMALDQGPGLAGHPRLRAFLRARLPGGAGAPPAAGGRLYVSRAGLDPIAQGNFLAEAALEAALAAAGWDILRPETRPLAAQLEAFARAGTLLFAEGSALHVFALVARPEQRVVILRRRLAGRAHFAAQLRRLGLARVEEWRFLQGVYMDADPSRRIAVFPHPRRRPEVAVLDVAALGERLMDEGLVPPGAWRPPDAAALAAETARLHALAAASDPGLALRLGPADQPPAGRLAEPAARG